ncbi:flavodoxin [Solidesulfovibrio sp.]|uniref:flavodoxin n=1 Tax=Solidesulfovibrio sp. TaxID=2910990 RepID=UPI0026034A39|nr:flavodoxin [Solidesulfovibrio sp.]
MSETSILMAFYSRAGMNYVGGNIVDLPVGNTAVAAGMIRDLTGGDLFKIETVKPYPAGYHETTDVAKAELRNDARPELVGRVADMAKYDVVCLGYPNWWGTMPMAVFTFLESYDFAGKTIAPLCTHEGSGMGRSENDIKKLCPGTKVLEGLPVRGGSVHGAASDIAGWLRRLGLVA